MKKVSILFVLLSVFSVATIAQTKISTGQAESQLKKLSAQTNYIEFKNMVGDISTMMVKSEKGVFVKLVVPGYYPSAQYGLPDLPEVSRMIEVPIGSKPCIEVVSYDEEIISLDEAGFSVKVMPSQPSMSKSANPEDVEFVYNEDFYLSGQVFAPEMIEVEKSGMFRGIQMARLVIRPFEYNAADNMLVVKNNLHVRVSFENGDMASTRSMKNRYYSPVFSNVYNKLWNYETPATKDVLSKYPIKYVIVSDPMFQDALQPFVEWKTQKGFHVIEAYTDDASVGNTTSNIKAYLQNLYTSATVDNPAPSYVLFVGDIAQVPVFNGVTDSHVTDLYYCTYDGSSDYIPELYFGRFSATSVEQLTPQIEKTLQFEQYTMPDPSYLGDAVMVAGMDPSWGATHANGQVNYGSTLYFNTAHGINAHVYHYPASGAQASEILSNISNGAGYVNYTAHCNADGWADPSFTINNISNLNNKDKYYVSVGNCCLSNKFDEPACFGEALLRANEEGAVAHLGGSNSTYWHEDYYWTVGLIATPISNPTYEGTGIGAYDALFHENGEEPYVTTAQMNYAGNLSVEASSSSRKKYYWEVYHVMGDPSLMPYLGIPSELNVNYVNIQPLGISSLDVTAEEGAYVAISLNGVLLDAKLADASGVVHLTFNPIFNITTADIVVTKQNRQPYIGVLDIINNDSDYDVQLASIVKPESLIFVNDASFVPEVIIRNVGQQNLTSASVSYKINDDAVVTQEWTGDIAFLEQATVTFPEITLTEGEYTFKAWASNPNGHVDEFPQNDTLIKDVVVYSGNVKLLSVEAPSGQYCNIQNLTPKCVVLNKDVNPLTSLVVGYTCGDVAYEMNWTGNIAPNQSDTITLPEATFPDGTQTISFYINSPNGGTDMDVSDNTKDSEFVIVLNGQVVVLDLLTDAYEYETSWELINNDTGDVLFTNGALSPKQHHISEWCLGKACYKFIIYDSYGDGLAGSIWSGAPGNFSITNTTTSEVYADNVSSFTQSYEVEFCIEDFDAVEDNLTEDNFSIYPNPTNDIITVQGNDMQSVQVIDNLGRVVFNEDNVDNQLEISLKNMVNSFVIVKVKTSTESYIKKVVILK